MSLPSFRVNSNYVTTLFMLQIKEKDRDYQAQNTIDATHSVIARYLKN